MRKPTRVAIIDDGINETIFNEKFLEYNLEIDAELQVVSRRNYHDLDFNHATICASIIRKYTKCDLMSSIKILNERAKSTVNQLVRAVEWCIEKEMDLVNISLGSTLNLDYEFLRNVVNQAYDRGMIIIAAQSNEGIFTYPASLTNVIGVNCDKAGIYTEREFAFNIYPLNGIDITANARHKLKDYLGREFITQNSNSFAAPVVTSIINDFLKQKPKMTIEEIRGKLRTASLNTDLTEYYPNVYHFLDWIKEAIIFVINDQGNPYNIEYYDFKVREIIYIDSNDVHVITHLISSYLSGSMQTLKTTDTVVIVNQISSYMSDGQGNLYLKELSKYGKDIVYLGENIDKDVLQLLEIDGIKNIKLYHQIINKSDILNRASRDVQIPFIFIYDFDGVKMNSLLFLLSKKFRENGYSLVTVSDSPQEILSGHKIVNPFKEGAFFESSLASLCSVHDPDIMIIGVKRALAFSRDKSTVDRMMNNFQSDLHMFIINDVSDLYNINDIICERSDNVLVLSNINETSSFECGGNVINCVAEDAIDKLYFFTLNFFRS
ncbi:S8 family serine peptidase [Paenibacillus sp. FSL K6-2524]|uniref:S8 family serine peptidase n=1 Tax=Paenibacillus sp. FSL K6-2524 TaxID=2954516 RepID=UPI0030FB1C61